MARELSPATRALLLGLLGLLVLAPIAAATISKDEFIRRADKVCARSEPKEQGAATDLFRAREREQAHSLARAAEQLSSVHLNLARRIRRIPDPDRDQGLARRFIREVRKVGEIYRNASRVADAGRFAAFDKKLDAIRAHIRSARGAAHDFDFERCGH